MPGASDAPRIVVLHGASADTRAPDDQDTLRQVQEITDSLQAQGYDARPLAMTLRLDALRERLLELAPRAVFNLVESVDGSDALLPLGPLLLEAMGIPYTGAPVGALVASSNKPEAKAALARAGIATPENWPPQRRSAGDAPATRWIVKSVWCHASLGLADDSVVDDPAQVALRLAERRRTYGGQWFAERFLPGREFNLSLLEVAGGVAVLPPAEILFQGFAADKPHIVGYAAKWHTDSAEYRATPRSFAFAAGDAPLLERLGHVARRCWEVFGLRGYARVDFRVDPQGRPWVLEVNANPCLAADAGFAAAAAQAGLIHGWLIRHIVEAALGRAGALPRSSVAQPQGDTPTQSAGDAAHTRRSPRRKRATP
ncbi:MAG: D-alanine--D-alanine ligase [Candidatus Lambdaproteobacteria bacterium]|nr:D-alanine--D-alanine ligase [Candidatus Lambdaproteobacteria bacterium]